MKEFVGILDLFFVRYNQSLFFHGCFWNKHESHLFNWPKTRPEFWGNKITGHYQMDKKQYAPLLVNDYRVSAVWECGIKGKESLVSRSVFR